jgi:hypothetical protein
MTQARWKKTRNFYKRLKTFLLWVSPWRWLVPDSAGGNSSLFVITASGGGQQLTAAHPQCAAAVDRLNFATPPPSCQCHRLAWTSPNTGLMMFGGGRWRRLAAGESRVAGGSRQVVAVATVIAGFDVVFIAGQRSNRFLVRADTDVPQPFAFCKIYVLG